MSLFSRKVVLIEETSFHMGEVDYTKASLYDNIRTYPLEVKDIELLQAAGRLETCTDWIDTLSRHDERFLGVAEKLQDALDDLISLLPAETMQPEE